MRRRRFAAKTLPRCALNARAQLIFTTAPEISQELRVNLSTVYTRLRAARQRFAAYLSAREPLHPSR